MQLVGLSVYTFAMISSLLVCWQGTGHSTRKPSYTDVSSPISWCFRKTWIQEVIYGERNFAVSECLGSIIFPGKVILGGNLSTPSAWDHWQSTLFITSDNYGLVVFCGLKFCSESTLWRPPNHDNRNLISFCEYWASKELNVLWEMMEPICLDDWYMSLVSCYN